MKRGLVASEAVAIEVARRIANAMIENTTDADPLVTRDKARAAMRLCNERKWPEAKKEFAYAAICCEFRWAKANPRSSRPTGPNSRERQG